MNSAGRTRKRNFCEFCEFCGRTPSASLFCRRVDSTQPKQSSHRLHRFSQIHWGRGRSHRTHRIHRIPNTHHLCKSVKSVGEHPLPVCSVNSVNSVGGHPLPVYSVNSVNSVGRTRKRNFCEFREFCGRTSLPVCSVNSVNSVGEHLPEQEMHRLLGWCT